MDFSTRLLLTLSLVVTALGALDAAISRELDLLALFVLPGLLQAAVWFRRRANRIDVTLRPDLAQWIGHRAQASGEPFDDVLDRGVAWFKHGLYAGEHADS